MEVVQDARKSLEALQLADTSRYDFIEGLLEQMKIILSRKNEIEEELKESDYIRASYRRDFESCKAELAVLKNSMARNSFVLVLIDGDAAPFRDEFIKQGTHGGESVARELKRSVVDYFSSRSDMASDFEVVIRVYSKMQYLTKTYHAAGILQDESTLQTFVQGFNRVDALCEYIDAGNDKEGADNKVQNTMKLFINNVHCKHTILCASQDDSYTGFLRQFIHNGKVSDHVTLVESIPFAHGLAGLSQNFLKTEFKDVFRSIKIVAIDPVKESPKEQPTVPQISTYAHTVSRGGLQTGNLPATIPVQAASTDGIAKAQNQPKILVNAADQRVDFKLAYYDPDIVTTLQSRKLCNRHFLSHCNYSNCFYSHDANLSPSELVALKFIARLGPCAEGSFCRDPNCVASHMCTYGTKCKNPDICRYPKDMHGLDPKPVRYVPALT